MCSVLFMRKPDVKQIEQYVKLQIDRWRDAVGCINAKYYLKNTLNLFATSLDQVKTDWVMTHINGFLSNKENETLPYLHHVRKPSVWTNTVDNTHPIEVEKNYLIIQNGTHKEIENRAKYQFEDYEKWKPDTYRIGRLIKDKHWKELGKDAYDRLLKYPIMWIIFIIDWLASKVFLFSDGWRDCCVEFEQEWEDEFVKSISNFNLEDPDKKTEYNDLGYIVFDFNTGKVLEKDFSESRKKKPVTVRQPWWTFQHARRSQNYYSQFDMEDDWTESGMKTKALPHKAKYVTETKKEPKVTRKLNKRLNNKPLQWLFTNDDVIDIVDTLWWQNAWKLMRIVKKIIVYNAKQPTLKHRIKGHLMFTTEETLQNYLKRDIKTNDEWLVSQNLPTRNQTVDTDKTLDLAEAIRESTHIDEMIVEVLTEDYEEETIIAFIHGFDWFTKTYPHLTWRANDILRNAQDITNLYKFINFFADIKPSTAYLRHWKFTVLIEKLEKDLYAYPYQWI